MRILIQLIILAGYPANAVLGYLVGWRKGFDTGARVQRIEAQVKEVMASGVFEDIDDVRREIERGESAT